MVITVAFGNAFLVAMHSNGRGRIFVFSMVMEEIIKAGGIEGVIAINKWIKM